MARLIADIGGTNARFALAGAGRIPEAEQTLQVAAFEGPGDAALSYLGERRVREGVFAVATAIEGDRVKLTNAPWDFSIEATRTALGLDRLVVINDFVAQAAAVPRLAAAELEKLGGGEPLADRNIALIGPGTGLGVGALVPSGGRWKVIPSEGGHVSFAPANEIEDRILSNLRPQFGRVSSERLLSGPGLVNIARALSEIRSAPLAAASAADVTRAAADGSCAVCAEAVHVFVGALAAAAGDLALTFLARGGVYVCGGICPRFGSLFDVTHFRQRFADKGRFRPYLETVPTYLILRENNGLLGAAAYDIDQS